MNNNEVLKIMLAEIGIIDDLSKHIERAKESILHILIFYKKNFHWFLSSFNDLLELIFFRAYLFIIIKQKLYFYKEIRLEI